MARKVGIKRLFMALFIIWSFFTVFLSLCPGMIIFDSASAKTMVLLDVYTFILANIPFGIWLLYWFKKSTSNKFKKNIAKLSIVIFILFSMFTSICVGLNIFIALICGLILTIPGWIILLIYWVSMGFAQGEKDV